MKPFTVILLIMYSAIMSYAYTNVVKIDKDDFKKDKPTQLEYNFNVGLGLAHGSEHFQRYFNLAPVMVIGTEFSLSTMQNWSLDILIHSWIGESKTDYPDWELKRVNSNYYYIEDNYYYQYGISFSIKYYLVGNKYSKFRSSIHLGKMFTHEKDGYNANDIGFAVLYKMTDTYSIGLSYRSFFNLSFDLGGGTSMQYSPNLITVNLNIN